MGLATFRESILSGERGAGAGGGGGRGATDNEKIFSPLSFIFF